MEKISSVIKKKLAFGLILMAAVSLLLIIRVVYIETVKSDFLQPLAYEQQTRDRLISAQRYT